mmetsp:Transcript_7212/g.16177  ORF Transcript_7212/g.16177 Transcript_7212/m.16177 type:complete len:304 (-) Transcript_7212:300-1211(-)|eukprot:CAMPEP_0179609058 /NCGR_PEP_ID=MMETSP0930-20121108/2780_1 /TAXON_ID=548131 ORGANISM="Ostreococcus mediterraneus, Strain clade-D-RCC1621" /NCGR_SAMPLE_ID=MMETSP0930 /ASSEMBLY_ACC=CAM_ASM_000580 /LENGTH=303 /DNA_ID=CAMNT_0021477585 /DNA_START=2178 /DNA_END=3089 /DNA_ORIENTATION=+
MSNVHGRRSLRFRVLALNALPPAIVLFSYFAKNDLFESTFKADPTFAAEPTVTAVVLTQTHLGRRMFQLCSTLASLNDSLDSEIHVLWSRAQLGTHKVAIKLFVEQCHSAQRETVKHILQPKPEFDESTRCLNKNCAQHGIAYLSAMSYSRSLNSTVLLVEGDVLVSADIKQLLREVHHRAAVALSLYHPGAIVSVRNRKLSSAYAQRVPAFGTQGYLFTELFLRIFLADAQLKSNEVVNADLELMDFCANTRSNITFMCGMSVRSLVQHIGRESELFSDGAVNSRFHEASDWVPFDPVITSV